MFLFFNIIYFFYPLYIMIKEQIFMTRNLWPSNKNYQQQKQNIIKYEIELTNWYTSICLFQND